MALDRDAIRQSLAASHRTWRWNGGDRTRYAAVETTSEGLRWFRWSHDTEGPDDELRQSFDDFRAHGPAWPAPKSVAAAVRAWIDGRLP